MHTTGLCAIVLASLKSSWQTEHKIVTNILLVFTGTYIIHISFVADSILIGIPMFSIWDILKDQWRFKKKPYGNHLVSILKRY